MIDCPICHVKNHEDARFCLECGQRLGAPAAGQAPAEPGPPIQQNIQPEPPAPVRQKLHSPLLNDSSDEYPQGESSSNFGGQQAQSANEVNRLRQMSGRQQDPPPLNQGNPNQPYKNPFDPRNASTEGSAPQHNPEQPRKLRSPLLSSDEFDDDSADQGQAKPRRGANLRSPLLGGADAGNSGYRQQYDEVDDAPQGGQLRSPLLGGGASSPGGYPGGERRKANPTDSSYGANDRRRGGLRSPMLSGGEAEYDDYDQDEDDEPLDEDNPNVLRSPLLAARRPMNDRQRKEPAPTNSNTQNPPAAVQMPDPGQSGQNPSSAYTSIKSIQPQGQPPAPQAVPPMPMENPPAAQQRPDQAGLPAGYAGYQEPPRPAQAPPAAQAPLAPQGPPTNVPPSFSSGFGGGQVAPSAQPMRPQEPDFAGAGRGINVQPPTPSRSLPSYKAADSNASADEPIKTKGRPKLLSSGYESDDETDNYVPASANRYAVEPRPSSPIPKAIGVVAVLLLLMKAWAFKDFVSTDWGKIAWLVTDQFVTMGVIVCLAVLAFTRKD